MNARGTSHQKSVEDVAHCKQNAIRLLEACAESADHAAEAVRLRHLIAFLEKSEREEAKDRVASLPRNPPEADEAPTDPPSQAAQ